MCVNVYREGLEGFSEDARSSGDSVRPRSSRDCCRDDAAGPFRSDRVLGAWAWHADAAVSDVVTDALPTFGSPGGLVLAMSRFGKKKENREKKKKNQDAFLLLVEKGEGRGWGVGWGEGGSVPRGPNRCRLSVRWDRGPSKIFFSF